MTSYKAGSVIEAHCTVCEKSVPHDESQIDEATNTGTLLLHGRTVGTFVLFTGQMTCDRCGVRQTRTREKRAA